jgi:hypothetical protein
VNVVRYPFATFAELRRDVAAACRAFDDEGHRGYGLNMRTRTMGYGTHPRRRRELYPPDRTADGRAITLVYWKAGDEEPSVGIWTGNGECDFGGWPLEGEFGFREWAGIAVGARPDYDASPQTADRVVKFRSRSSDQPDGEPTGAA